MRPLYRAAQRDTCTVRSQPVSIFIFILSQFLSITLFNRKCLLAKIQENKFLPPRIEVDLVIKCDGPRGITDEFATIPFHLVL